MWHFECKKCISIAERFARLIPPRALFLKNESHAADENDIALVDAFVAMGYGQGRAIKTLEMCRYDVNFALDILMAEDEENQDQGECLNAVIKNRHFREILFCKENVLEAQNGAKRE